MRHNAQVTDVPQIPEAQAEIDVRLDGPLQARGPLTLHGSDGRILREVGAGDSVWLCRCGQSARKPYCDGSHKRVGFTDPGLGED